MSPFELKGGTGPATAMCLCGEFLEMYTADKTFRVQSPESINPKGINPNALWVTTPISDVGSKNPIISRVLIQGHEILKAASFQKTIDKTAATVSLHKCKEHLLACEKIAKKIAAETDRIILKIQTEGIEIEKNGRGLNPFPHITNLPTDCSTFLIEAKRAIISICQLATIFLDDLNGTENFDELSKRLTSKLEADAPLLNFINSNAKYIKHIIELRNHDEHPKVKKTVIENFRYTSNMEIAVPQWHITGDDRGDEPRPIKEEMLAIVNYLLEMAEAMLIHLVMTTVKKEIPFIIIQIENSKIEQYLPIKYKLSIDIDKWLKTFRS